MCYVTDKEIIDILRSIIRQRRECTFYRLSEQANQYGISPHKVRILVWTLLADEYDKFILTDRWTIKYIKKDNIMITPVTGSPGESPRKIREEVLEEKVETLQAKIEELNATIKNLEVENMRLKTSLEYTGVVLKYLQGNP